MNLGNQADVKVVCADNGVVYLVRIVRKGDPYGQNWCLNHMVGADALDWKGEPKDERWAEPMVEFYDARHESDTHLGYFVSRYYASTLLGTGKYSNRKPGVKQGLDLHGGQNEWKIDAETMHRVGEWIKSRIDA